MNTDVSLEFRAKLFTINKKIKKIEEINFNVDQYKNELNNIINELNTKIMSSKNIKFDGFIISDYTNAINKLNKLEYILDEYEIYIKAYYYVKYLKTIELSKENINDIVNELMNILKGIRNSSVLDYKDEDKIVESLYHQVYNVIKLEIELNNTNRLYNFCKLDEIDSSFLEEEISKEIETFDVDKYSNILIKYYEIMKEGNTANLFNLDLITSIIYKDRQEELIESTKRNISQLASDINAYTIDINILKQEKYEKEKNIALRKKNMKTNYNELIKKLCTIALILSIPVGSFFLLKTKKYETTTKTYNSYTGNVLEEISYHTEKNESVYAYSYDNSGYNSKVTSYNLSFLNYDSIYDYAKYFEEDHNLVIQNYRYVDKTSISVQDNVDYFEIVYKYVNMDNYEYSYMFPFITLWFSLSFLVLDNKYFINKINIFATLKNIRNTKIFMKKDIDKLREISRILLDKVKEDEILRLKFNEEVNNHKEIIDLIDLDYEIINNNSNSKEIKNYNKKLIK